MLSRRWSACFGLVSPQTACHSLSWLLPSFWAELQQLPIASSLPLSDFSSPPLNHRHLRLQKYAAYCPNSSSDQELIHHPIAFL